MAEHIEGPLYYERMGRTGPVMAFVHPNPMDQSCWVLQMAQLSTWYRCVAIDIRGYGRSPKAEPGLTMRDTAQACWETIDAVAPGEKAILVGCSVGSAAITYMHHERPPQTAALILSGTGYNPDKAFAPRRIKEYGQYGLDYRWRYTFDDFSPAFRATGRDVNGVGLSGALRALRVQDESVRQGGTPRRARSRGSSDLRVRR